MSKRRGPKTMGRPGVDPYREPLPNEALITFDSLFDGVKLPRFTDEEMKVEAAKRVGKHIAKKLDEDEEEPQIKSWYEKRVVFLGQEIRMGVLDEDVLHAFADVLDEMVVENPMTDEEVKAILIETGLDPAEIAAKARQLTNEFFSREFEDAATGTIEGEIVKEPPRMIDGPKTEV